jgi:3-oxoacyl-[acyl-carrier-protein] synthase-3
MGAQTAAISPSARQAAIVGTGSFLPEAVLDNAQLEAMVETSDAWILERTGIRERRRAGSGQTTSMMAAEAGRRALAAAGSPRVDVLIVATFTPDTLTPSAACLVQRRLGLAGIPAFDVNAACAGYVYSLAMARALIQAGTAETVLVVAAESTTSVVDYSDRSTCVLFGDGAGATVLARVGDGDGGITAINWGADGSEADLIYYGPKMPEGDGPDGLRMYGKGTFRTAVERMTGVATQLCADSGWSPADIDLFVPHQANLRIIEATAKRLAVPMEKVMVTLDRFGNTSAASVPIALAEALAAGLLHQGDKVVCAAFGAGSTWGGVAMTWQSPPGQ